MKPVWLGRDLAAPGPYLTLVLSQEEFDATLRSLGIKESTPFLSTPHAHATCHFCTNQAAEQCCIVALGDTTGRLPVEVAGLLVHEAVHVWQDYAERIGERNPGKEQEAYAIQNVAQQLMAAYADRLGAKQ